MYPYQFAKLCHKNQVRRFSGKPYIDHVARVAQLVTVSSINSYDTVSAAYLHDVIEDCHWVSYEDLYEYFGRDIANFVRELTNPPKDENLLREKRKEIDRLHIKTASYQAQVIKLFDRYDNITEMLQDVQLGNIKSDFPKIYATETLLLLDVFSEGVKKNFEKYVYYTQNVAHHFLKR